MSEPPQAGSGALDLCSVEGLEQTNNLAERGLRPVVLWRRRSPGPKAAGSEFVALILTVVTALRQQQRDVLEYLKAACEAFIGGAPPLSLLPTYTA